VTAAPGRLVFDFEWRISLFAAVFVPLMVALGFWQLQRAEEKTALSATWEARQQQPPAALSDVWDSPAEALAYLPVKLSGTFVENDAYFLLDNRIREGRFGYEVLDVLRLEGDGRLVVVNRGWIAGDAARRALPDVPAVTGTVDLVGHVYVAPGAPYLLGEQHLQPGWPKVLQAVEMDKLVPELERDIGGKVFSRPVRLDPGQPGALLADWQVVNVSPEKHQAYAVQWFAMSTVLLVFYLLRCSNLWQLLKSKRTKS
jgi:surfeit locus 1 family protein